MLSMRYLILNRREFELLSVYCNSIIQFNHKVTFALREIQELGLGRCGSAVIVWFCYGGGSKPGSVQGLLSVLCLGIAPGSHQE